MPPGSLLGTQWCCVHLKCARKETYNIKVIGTWTFMGNFFSLDKLLLKIHDCLTLLKWYFCPDSQPQVTYLLLNFPWIFFIMLLLVPNATDQFVVGLFWIYCKKFHDPIYFSLYSSMWSDGNSIFQGCHYYSFAWLSKLVPTWLVQSIVKTDGNYKI